MKKYLLILSLLIISCFAHALFAGVLDDAFKVSLDATEILGDPAYYFQINPDKKSIDLEYPDWGFGDPNPVDITSGEATKQTDGTVSYSTYFAWNIQSLYKPATCSVSINAEIFKTTETTSSYTPAIVAITTFTDSANECWIVVESTEASSVVFEITNNNAESVIPDFTGYVQLTIRPENIYSLVSGTYESVVTITIRQEE